MNRILTQALGASALTVVGIASVAAPAPAHAEEAVYTFDIPSQELGSALRTFGRAARQQVSFDSALTRGKRSVAIKGRHTATDALRILLGDSGLGFQRSARGVILIVAAPAPATVAVQTAPVTGAEPEPEVPVESEEAIVVTGSSIRGIAPVGTNVAGIGREEIRESSAVSTNEAIATIPQLANFGGVPRAGGDFAGAPVTVNIRNLGASGGSTTLVLVNGHRLVGQGIVQTIPDPSVVPAGLLDRIEVVLDGGSSVYGSDAIGGVVNLITRRSFDGIAANLRYGHADGYNSYDGDLTAGRTWDTGSAIVGFAYAKRDGILGIDRDFFSNDHRDRGGSDFRSAACAPGNITVAGTSYALPGRVAGTTNRCDPTDYAHVIFPETRYNVFGTVTQDLGNRVEANVTGYWAKRSPRPGFAQLTTSGGVITSANPYFRAIGAETSQSVTFSYAPVFGPTNVFRQELESWGVTPGLKWNIDGNWQLRASVNYGESTTESFQPTLNQAAVTAALVGTTTGTALNPYDLTATNADVLARIRDSARIARSRQELVQGRVIADGVLFSLGGGDVRLAVGVETLEETLRASLYDGPLDESARTNWAFGSRNVRSAFGELFVPLVGEGNALPGMRRLDLSASVRHDDYSDVGGQTNPKFGLNYEPFEGFVLRGAYGTSFHAPSLGDSVGAVDTQATVLATSTTRAPGSPASDLLRPTIRIAGGNPDLKPETAETWSAGFEFRPPFLPGLRLSGSYFDVHMRDVIGLAPFAEPRLFTDPTFTQYRIVDPTLAQARAFVGGIRLNGALSLDSLYAGASPYALIDARRTNLGDLKVRGLDFGAYYSGDLGSVRWDLSMAGSYTLERTRIVGATRTNELLNGSGPGPNRNLGRLNLIGTTRLQWEGLTGKATVNYNGGFPVVGYASQTEVEPFVTTDLFLSYRLAIGARGDSVTLSLSVDNLFDEKPSFLNTANFGGVGLGSTFGRLVSVGVGTQF